MKRVIRKAMNRQKHDIIQFIKFNIVGISNTVIDMGVFILLTTYLKLYYVVAQIISYACGIINSFACNKCWTFQNKEALDYKMALKFLNVNLLSLSATLFMLYILNDVMHINIILAKVFTIFFSTMINFIGNKRWVFNAK